MLAAVQPYPVHNHFHFEQIPQRHINLLFFCGFYNWLFRRLPFTAVLKQTYAHGTLHVGSMSREFRRFVRFLFESLLKRRTLGFDED
jgi:hypothetical protein